MIEVWTEDTGAGYIITKNMIKAYYGHKHIFVKPHDGNGSNKPKPNISNSNGGILYDLIKNRQSNNVIIILVDMALDNVSVQIDIENIKKRIKVTFKFT